MSITTVGELIESLRLFDINTPVLVNNFEGVLYRSVSLNENLLFKVIPEISAEDSELFADADHNDPNSFYAIIL